MLPLFFGRRDLADLTETIMGDVKTIEHAYSHVLPELYGAYIMLVVAAVGLVAFDWWLAIAALWSAPVALGLLFGARRALQPMMHATRMRGLAISEDIQEALECVREVRATNQEERYLEHIRADIDAAEHQAAKSEIACGVCVNGAQIVLRLGIATTILVGSMLVLVAARAANCDGFVSRMPEGYQTMVGENGARLSGGERQRISIARALLKDAPIVLLDEATASLDVENETEVQGALSRLLAGRTVIVIAHRMRTVMAADKVVVLNGGRVAEQGSPQELMAQDGLFARMVRLQTESAEWAL